MNSLVMALSGQVGRIYELEHEILERKQAESALRHERDLSAQRYLDHGRSHPAARSGHADEVAFTRGQSLPRAPCFGWTADELLGRDWIETCRPPEDAKDCYEHGSVNLARRGPCRHRRHRHVTSPAEDRLDRMAQHAAAR